MFFWFLATGLSTVSAATPDDDALIIRVFEADPGQAPMLHLGLGSSTLEGGCTDDGTFPDTVADDGIFYCLMTIPQSSLSQDEWPLKITTRTRNGEDFSLGNFNYPGGAGPYFATVFFDDGSAGHQEVFSLGPSSTGPKSQAPPEFEEPLPVHEDTEPPEFEELQPVHVEMAPPQAQPPPQPPPQSGPPVAGEPKSSIPTKWILWSLIAFGLGWLVPGRKSSLPHTSKPVDGARLLRVPPIAGGGPVPCGSPVVISSTSPPVTVQTVMGELTVSRRIVLLSDEVPLGFTMAQDVFLVTDPDRHAVAALIRGLATDGGLPPVLMICGRHAAIDIGSASADPTLDLVDAVCSHTWVAWFLSESESVADGFLVWDHDHQAGWSAR